MLLIAHVRSAEMVPVLVEIAQQNAGGRAGAVVELPLINANEAELIANNTGALPDKLAPCCVAHLAEECPKCPVVELWAGAPGEMAEVAAKLDEQAAGLAKWHETAGYYLRLGTALQEAGIDFDGERLVTAGAFPMATKIIFGGATPGHWNVPSARTTKVLPTINGPVPPKDAAPVEKAEIIRLRDELARTINERNEAVADTERVREQLLNASKANLAMVHELRDAREANRTVTKELGNARAAHHVVLTELCAVSAALNAAGVVFVDGKLRPRYPRPDALAQLPGMQGVIYAPKPSDAGTIDWTVTNLQAAD